MRTASNRWWHYVKDGIEHVDNRRPTKQRRGDATRCKRSRLQLSHRHRVREYITLESRKAINLISVDSLWRDFDNADIRDSFCEAVSRFAGKTQKGTHSLRLSIPKWQQAKIAWAFWVFWQLWLWGSRPATDTKVIYSTGVSKTCSSDGEARTPTQRPVSMKSTFLKQSFRFFFGLRRDICALSIRLWPFVSMPLAASDWRRLNIASFLCFGSHLSCCWCFN